MERTQVAIVGGGPAGMLLSHMLHLDDIDSIVLERQPRDHVLKRIRAGVLEYGTVKLLRDVGLGERMEREGHAHDGSWIAWENRRPFLIDTKRHTGKQMWAEDGALRDQRPVFGEQTGPRRGSDSDSAFRHDAPSARLAPRKTVLEGGVFQPGEDRGMRFGRTPRSSHGAVLPGSPGSDQLLRRHGQIGCDRSPRSASLSGVFSNRCLQRG